MNLSWKTSLRVFLLTSVSIFCLQCSHKKSRVPAGAVAIVTDSEAEALNQIFGGDSPNRPYRHPMKFNFYTNGDKKYLSAQAKKALGEAFEESLSGEAPAEALGKIVAGNLKESVVENFIKTMRLYKIVNTGLQVDLTFVPEPHQNRDFSPEFNSNQLVRFSETGKLAHKWQNIESATIMGSLYKNSTAIPVRSGDADYLGGIVTLYVEILDLNPLKRPLAVTTNGVKGFIRYRRYYRLNQEIAKSVACEGFVMGATKAEGDPPLFYTVDLYKNFNLKNLIPTEEALEIYPGVLATTSHGRRELMPNNLDKVGESVTTANIYVSKTTNYAGTTSYSLPKIVYDLKERKLDVNRIEIKRVSSLPVAMDNGGSEEIAAALEFRREFLKKCQSPLEKFLQLSTVVPGGTL